MKKPYIAGIQQMGVGIPSVYEAWGFYRKNFGFDVPIFDEAAEAGLMLPYTGGQPQSRHAVLAINLQGGGGLEIWQYKGRTPVGPHFDILLGDLGINIAKIKSKDVEATFNKLMNAKTNVLCDIQTDPSGQQHFFVKDPYDNIFQVIPSESWYMSDPTPTGGIEGAIIGVTDIERARTLYSDILGYDEVIYDEVTTFNDLSELDGGSNRFRRVLLKHTKPRVGPFSQMLGSSVIELIAVKDREPKKIYQDRLWGDLGFIHLCFDINGMKEMRTLCESKGFPFTVDSSDSFDMGEAAGHFSYIEDPDGTLIEFVETHKIPILKKINWYLDLTKRAPDKPLPKWMLKSLRFNKVKD